LVVTPLSITDLSIRDDIALLAVRSRDRRTKAAYSAQQSINATLLCSRSGTESDVTPQH
jgi:hypothetical protein